MKKIQISKEKTVLVDNEDYKELMTKTWYAQEGNKTWYAYVTLIIDNKPKSIAMHRCIMDLELNDPRQVDHINGNGLDNRKINLRLATNQQNCFNVAPKHKDKTSIFKGVYKTKSGKYEAQIKLNYKSNSLGRYNTPEEAAKVYDSVAMFYVGEFAYTNTEKNTIIPQSIEEVKATLRQRLIKEGY